MEPSDAEGPSRSVQDTQDSAVGVVGGEKASAAQTINRTALGTGHWGGADPRVDHGNGLGTVPLHPGPGHAKHSGRARQLAPG